MDPKLINIAIEATKRAGIAAYSMVGKKDKDAADRLAVDAMRKYLNSCAINSRVVIGEGERDVAPMLYIGEQLGLYTQLLQEEHNECGNLQKPEKKIDCSINAYKVFCNDAVLNPIDIAVDPLEGTALLAHNKPGAISVIAFAKKGGLLQAPDIYMEKIGVHVNFDERIIDLDNTVKENLKNIALAKKISISDIIVTILNRKRHEELIAKVDEAGAKVKLIDDGDVTAVIGTSKKFNLSDVYMGIGGAPEGVLAAAALQNTMGQMCSKLIFENSQEEKKAAVLGIKDFKKQYFLDDMASPSSIFVATGVTDGEILKGVQIINGEYITSSLTMHNRLIVNR